MFEFRFKDGVQMKKNLVINVDAPHGKPMVLGA